jgi:tRNA uracil 4-sulfurtransferase
VSGLGGPPPPGYDALVVHHHELGLKGKNREFFEGILLRNLKRALRHTGYKKMHRIFGRIIVDLSPDALAEEAAQRAANLFGVAYVGLGRKVKPDLEMISEIAMGYMLEEPFESFRVRARRTYSSFEGKSQLLHEVLGQRIKDATGGRVDLKHAEATAWIELFANSGIVYRKRFEGPGGLPSGVSGKMICLLSGGIDSPVAAWRMARRGCTVEYLHFHGQPFTDRSSVGQAVEIAQAFTRYHPSIALHLIPLGDIQQEIVMNCPAELRVVLYRRFMMRIASRLAKQRRAQALITGDALGQVASQTIENITTISAAIPDTQVIRPLIGMTKQEIMDTAELIGTYEISTRKYQDCCVLFEPRSPAIRSTIDEATEAEAELDVDALVEKALQGLETRLFELGEPPGWELAAEA